MNDTMDYMEDKELAFFVQNIFYKILWQITVKL